MNQTRPRIHSNIGFHVEIPQMLETINTQYAGQGIVATAIAGLGTERCNCGFERIPPHDIVYSSREILRRVSFLLTVCPKLVKLSSLLTAIPCGSEIMVFNGKVGTCSDLP